LSGRPLERRPSDPAATKAMAEQVRQDERDRYPVEGEFGEGKRRRGLNRIMARPPDAAARFSRSHEISSNSTAGGEGPEKNQFTS
jgi:hypothetical protein